ncbi:unnamed protein product [Toxocara canis]|uniref:Uncharacterized protein n=1 Tax=Toxocara canis TaxID=6265 RepID=A0A183U1P5_TOXCA|nr:unnamed protein product [Toxocara canis]
MTLNAITPISDIAEAEVQKSMSSSFNWDKETNANVNQTNNVSSLKKLSNIPLNPSLNPPLNPPLCNEIHHKKRLSLPIPMYYEKYHCTPTKQQFNESAPCECSLVECFCDNANWRKRSTVSMDTADTSKRWCSLRTPSHTLMNPLTLSAMIEQNTMDDEEDDDEIIILDALDGSAFKQKFKCWLEESKQSHHGVNVDTIEHSESFTTAYENFI